MSVFQLTYRSEAIENLQEKDIQSILELAKQFNSKQNITGCLVYNNRSFIQILEGEEVVVRELYDKIAQDKRHYAVNLLWESDSHERFFPDWHMCYYLPGNQDKKIFTNNLKLLCDLSDNHHAILLTFWSAVNRSLQC